MNAPVIKPKIDRAQIVAFAEYLGSDAFSRKQAGGIASRLKWPQQMQLVEHARGPRRITVLRQGDVRTMNALIARGLIQPARRKARPSHTIATEQGRAVIAYLLGKWADVLAGLQEGDR